MSVEHFHSLTDANSKSYWLWKAGGRWLGEWLRMASPSIGCDGSIPTIEPAPKTSILAHNDSSFPDLLKCRFWYASRIQNSLSLSLSYKFFWVPLSQSGKRCSSQRIPRTFRRWGHLNFVNGCQEMNCRVAIWDPWLPMSSQWLSEIFANTWHPFEMMAVNSFILTSPGLLMSPQNCRHVRHIRWDMQCSTRQQMYLGQF